jgi:oligoribonuclease NrnB/cAMP/cGMP phosphodiesterase (DHH superfamily)
MRVIICSHEADIDGIYSAAVALMRYPKARISFYNYGLENFGKMFEYIKNQAKSSKKGLAIISDLGINDGQVSALAVDFINFLKQRQWHVIWVDHHPWQKESLDSLKKICTIYHDCSGTKCATEIMYEKLMRRNKIAEQLKLIAHGSDFMVDVKNHDSRVSELIHFYRNSSGTRQKLASLVQKGSKGVLWDSQMQKDYLKFIKVAELHKSRSLKTLTIRKIRQFSVAFVFTYPLVQSSLFANEVFSYSKADLVMLFNKKGKVSIRRNSDMISCSKIASYLVEGGGHEFASGGMLKCNPKDFASCISEMELAVKKSLK